jgi:hypothetical protein
MTDLFSRYEPDTVPYSGANPTTRQTSIDAAEAIAPRVSHLESVVLACLGHGGATCDEIERLTGLSHQTASARLRELTIRGLVAATGQTRATRSGRQAAIMGRVETA